MFSIKQWLPRVIDIESARRFAMINNIPIFHLQGTAFPFQQQKDNFFFKYDIDTKMQWTFRIVQVETDCPSTWLFIQYINPLRFKFSEWLVIHDKKNAEHWNERDYSYYSFRKGLVYLRRKILDRFYVAIHVTGVSLLALM